MILLIEIVGWTGAICVLGAYILLSTKRLAGDSVIFQLLNVVGAAGFIVNTWWHGAIPSMALNIVWLAVGAYALVAIARGKSRPGGKGDGT